MDNFEPTITPGTNLQQACINVASGAASARVEVDSRAIQISVLTNPVYIRLGGPDVTVSATNGFHLSVGAVIRWQLARGANHLAYIQDGGAGAISIAPGLAE